MRDIDGSDVCDGTPHEILAHGFFHHGLHVASLHGGQDTDLLFEDVGEVYG